MEHILRLPSAFNNRLNASFHKQSSSEINLIMRGWSDESASVLRTDWKVFNRNSSDWHPRKKERVKPLSEVLMQTVAKFFASQQRKQPFSIRKAARVSAKRVREEIVWAEWVNRGKIKGLFYGSDLMGVENGGRKLEKGLKHFFFCSLKRISLRSCLANT